MPPATLRTWHDEGAVEWLGFREDMPTVLAASSIVCLPSYREGLPKALLEAAASARAIVTTDTPGCREVCRHEVNGLLVPVRDGRAVAAAVSRLLADPALRRTMGRRGRELVERELSLAAVINQTLAVYRALKRRRDTAIRPIGTVRQDAVSDWQARRGG